MPPLDYLEAIHGHDPDAAIIWLHGLGADANDFTPMVQQLNLPADLSVHFLFPHAPTQRVTLNEGASMPAWYDIYALSMDADEDEQGIHTSMQALEALITDKFSHFDPQRIILAGFSQGGALALHTLLHGKITLGGVIALSTYLPLRHLSPDANKQRVLQQEVFMAHGEYDEVLPLPVGELAHGILQTLGAHIHWRSYPMAHELCTLQIEHISHWIVQRLR